MGRRACKCGFELAVLLVGLNGWTGVVPQDAAAPSGGPVPQESQLHPPVKLSQKEMKKLIVKRARPEYPRIAHTDRGDIVGKCVVEITINPQGEIENWRLISGHPMLAPAAVDAAKRSKYRAYAPAGHPVEAQGEIEYEVHP